MEQSPSWGGNRSSVSQEIPRILWNLKFHYRVHKRQPPVPVLSQSDSVHVPCSHFSEIHFSIIIPCTPGSSKFPHSSRFPHQNPPCASLLPQILIKQREITLFLTHQILRITCIDNTNYIILGDIYTNTRSLHPFSSYPLFGSVLFLLYRDELPINCTLV